MCMTIAEALRKQAYADHKAEEDVALSAAAALDKQTAIIEAAHEALKYARPLVEKWCHTQGSSETFFAETLAPIDAALAKMESRDDG